MNGTAQASHRWSVAQANAWYKKQPWLCGCNFLPSTAVNSTEMWQEASFDPDTIDRELGWASGIGFNTCRVFLQYVVWEHDAKGLKSRIDRFLRIADRHSISTMLILFDDCMQSGREPYLGEQDAPVPGVHNSGWTPSPGHHRVMDRSQWDKFARYTQDIIGTFAHDKRMDRNRFYDRRGVFHGHAIHQAFGRSQDVASTASHLRDQPFDLGLQLVRGSIRDNALAAQASPESDVIAIRFFSA